MSRAAALPPGTRLKVKRVVRPPEPDFVAAVAVAGDDVFFHVDDSAHVEAEVWGEQCTLFLSEAAWKELMRQMKLPGVMEFGTGELCFSYELPLQNARMLHEGSGSCLVVATRQHVVYALHHPLPD